MKNSSVSILAIGSEILDGRVQDTNSAFIASQLAANGIRPGQFLVCDDSICEIVEALNYLSKSSGLVIVTGGLGPTSDDVTREAIAKYCGKKLLLNEEEFEHLCSFFGKRKRPVDESHRLQAMIPESARRIPNPVGSASGFVVETAGLTIITLPGVPLELKAMFSESVEAMILDHCGIKECLHTRILRVFGLPESVVGDRVDALGLSSDVFVSYRAMFPEVQVKLKTRRDEAFIADIAAQVKTAIGAEKVFSESLEMDFPQLIFQLFTQSRKTLATAESCSGGLLGKMLTDVPGSSAYYLGGVVSYSNSVKTALLDVDECLFEENGAVSEEVAIQMAEGVRKRLNADYGISITGIAGPEGGAEEKPVGTFFIGLSSSQASFARKFFFFSDRERIRGFACFAAMQLLREALEANMTSL